MNKERFYDVINAILSFLFCRWLFMTFLFYQFTTIFMTVDFWPTLAAILLMTGFCFTLFRLVYKPHISRLTLWFFYACYGLLLGPICIVFDNCLAILTKDINIFITYQLMNFHIGPIICTDGQGSVEHEFHVTCTRSFFGCKRNLF